MSNVRTIMSQAAAAGTAPPTAWDSDYLYPNDPRAWDISTTVYTNKSATIVKTYETNPNALSFKPDGTKMYIVGGAGDGVDEYSLSTAWDITTASYVSTFSILGQDGASEGLFFKPDGTKMYITGSNSDAVHEYDLSTAWDVSTASYVQSFSVSAQSGYPTSVFFKPDGTKMYITDITIQSVFEYDLSTAWDISTASLLQSFDISSQIGAAESVFFGSYGTRMYVVDSVADDITSYALSTPWDVSTAAFITQFSVAGQMTIPTGVFFKPDGSLMYIVGSATDYVFQYSLGGFSVGAQEATPRKVFFKPDGTRMYVMGETGDDINQYNLSTPWDTSTAIYAAVGSVSGQEANPQGMYFKSDGTTLYVIGITGDDVNQYNLTVPWDVSSLAYVKNSSVAAQDIDPQDIFFKPDGTKMFVLGNGGNAVYEYSLSTAWDVATKTYVQNFSVSAQDTTPTTFSFKPDGTKMFIHGFNSKFIYEYNLSTPWDLASASYSTKSYPSNNNEAAPWGIFIREEGTQLFLVGTTNDKVYTYSFGVPY